MGKIARASVSWRTDLKRLGNMQLESSEMGYLKSNGLKFSNLVQTVNPEDPEKSMIPQVEETTSPRYINIKLLKKGAKEKNLKSSEICFKTLNNEQQQRRRVWPPSHQKTIFPEGSEAHLKSTKWKNISPEPYSWQKYQLKTKAKYRSPKFNRFGSN